MSLTSNYQLLLMELDRVRQLNRGGESPEEESILNQMDMIWNQMNVNEREQTNITGLPDD